MTQDNQIVAPGERPCVQGDGEWMRQCVLLAREAERRGEVPVGAIVVADGEVVGRGHNQTIALADPTAHAEVIAIRAACSRLGNHRLPGATLYVTLEPCCMCAGAVIQARLSRVVYATFDPRAGACGSVFDLSRRVELNHSFEVASGVCADESRALLQAFFRRRR